MSTGTTTEYAGNYIYENGSLQFFHTPEGYVEPINASNYTLGFRHTFQYKDHLGNIRLSYKDLNQNTGAISLSIVEENNYYPFGLTHKGYNNVVSSNANSVASKYKFNGVEYEESLGLNLYEMDFRQYDAAIGRFSGMDDLSEDAYELTPYRFGFNNPIVFSDPTGLWEVINGGYSTTDKDEIERLLGYINRADSDSSTKGLMNYIKEDIKFMNEATENNQLSEVTVKEGGKISNRDVLRMQNEIAFHEGSTNYIYDNNDIRIRNNLTRDRRGKFYANIVRNWESQGIFKPLSATNYINWEAGGDERTARLLIFEEYSDMMGTVDDLGSSLGSLQVMAKRGRRSSEILGLKNMPGRGIPKNISFKQFVKKYSFAYRGKYKKSGYYLKAMSNDWRAITGK